MEHITIDHDIRILYVTASSFPEGIGEAYKRLESIVPASEKPRQYFGISRPENDGTIIYRAAVEVLTADEAEKLGCETLVLEKGTYISETVYDFMQNTGRIGEVFQRLISTPGLDPNGYCVERYIDNQHVQCMIRLAQ